MRPSSDGQVKLSGTGWHIMLGRRANGALINMTDNDNDVIVIVTERFERRLAEEGGKLRVEMAIEFGKVRAEMAAGFGALRAEMSDRNADLLKWGLVFGVTQTAAIAGIVALLR